MITLLTTTINGGILEKTPIHGGEEWGEWQMLNNLRAEMVRDDVTVSDIAKLLNLSERSIRDRLSGVYKFSLEEAITVRDRFFPGMDVVELFKNKERKA